MRAAKGVVIGLRIAFRPWHTACVNISKLSRRNNRACAAGSHARRPCSPLPGEEDFIPQILGRHDEPLPHTYPQRAQLHDRRLQGWDAGAYTQTSR